MYFPSASLRMSWLPGIARLFFPTAESLAIVTIVADACVSEDARRRTTRTAGTAIWKNRRRHRAMFTPSTEGGWRRYLGGPSTRCGRAVRFSTPEHDTLISPLSGARVETVPPGSGRPVPARYGPA